MIWRQLAVEVRRCWPQDMARLLLWRGITATRSSIRRRALAMRLRLLERLLTRAISGWGLPLARMERRSSELLEAACIARLHTPEPLGRFWEARPFPIRPALPRIG